jgi:imidazolonepropionase
MPVLTNIGVLATCRADGGQGNLHAIPDAAVAWEGPTVAWTGPSTELPERFRSDRTVDAGGRLVVPGLVDCHTHLAFAGWRADEFARRLQGATYQEIARAGGGIMSTVRATRAATFEQLVARCEAHLREMAALGVTTVEAKSGYGLDVDTEVRILEVYRALEERQPVTVVPTYLGAHVVPPEFQQRRGEYVESMCTRVIPEVARRGLARFCDAFLEDTAFGAAEALQYFAAGAHHGLRPKLHADQLTDGHGANLAADVGAMSADHLERVSDRGIQRLAEAGVVAVSLPIATLYLQQPPMPARRLIEAGVPVAVATDFNPGTAPSCHLPFAMTLACTLQRMTPAEVLKGATIVAARAIGEEREAGSIEVGKQADLALIDAADVNEWLYHLRANACLGTWKRGVRIAP